MHTNKLLVVGWGQTSYENKDLPTMLQEVVLDSINLTECSKKYQAAKGNKIYYSQICTWNKGQDACQVLFSYFILSMLSRFYFK